MASPFAAGLAPAALVATSLVLIAFEDRGLVAAAPLDAAAVFLAEAGAAALVAGHAVDRLGTRYGLVVPLLIPAMALAVLAVGSPSYKPTYTQILRPAYGLVAASGWTASASLLASSASLLASSVAGVLSFALPFLIPLLWRAAGRSVAFVLVALLFLGLALALTLRRAAPREPDVTRSGRHVVQPAAVFAAVFAAVAPLAQFPTLGTIKADAIARVSISHCLALFLAPALVATCCAVGLVLWRQRVGVNAWPPLLLPVAVAAAALVVNQALGDGGMRQILQAALAVGALATAAANLLHAAAHNVHLSVRGTYIGAVFLLAHALAGLVGFARVGRFEPNIGAFLLALAVLVLGSLAAAIPALALAFHTSFAVGVQWKTFSVHQMRCKTAFAFASILCIAQNWDRLPCLPRHPFKSVQRVYSTARRRFSP